MKSQHNLTRKLLSLGVGLFKIKGCGGAIFCRNTLTTAHTQSVFYDQKEIVALAWSNAEYILHLKNGNRKEKTDKKAGLHIIFGQT